MLFFGVSWASGAQDKKHAWSRHATPWGDDLYYVISCNFASMGRDNLSLEVLVSSSSPVISRAWTATTLSLEVLVFVAADFVVTVLCELWRPGPGCEVAGREVDGPATQGPQSEAFRQASVDGTF